MSSSLKWIGRGLRGAYRLSVRRPQWVLVAGLLCLLSVVGALKTLRTLTSFRDLFDKRFASVVRYDDVEQSFGAGNEVSLLVHSRTPGGEFLASDLCELGTWVGQQQLANPEILGVYSPLDLRVARNSEERLVYPHLLRPDCQPVGFSLEVLRNTPWSGILTDHEARSDLAVEFQLRDTPGGSRFGRFDPKPIGGLMRDFEQKLGARFEAIWTGPCMYDYYLHEGLKRFPILNLTVLLLILVLYRAFLGTWKAGAIFSVTLIFAGLLLYGLMARFGQPMDILSSSLFLMLTVAAHQDFSYLSMERLANPSVRLQRTFLRFVVPSFFTSLTTVAGFGSLCLSELTIIRRFGFWASVGAIVEWLMIFMVLPAAIELFPRLGRWVRQERVWVGRRPESRKRLLSLNRKVSYALLGVFVAVPFAVRYANFSDDPKLIFPKSHPFQAALAYLKSSRGWDGSLSLVFDAPLPAERIQTILGQLRHDPLVGQIESRYEVERFYTNALPPARAELVLRDLRASSLLARYVAADGRSRAIVYINSSDLVQVRGFKQRLAGLCPVGECFVAGPIDMYVEFIHEVSRTLTGSLAMSLVLVTAILLYLVRANGTPQGWALILTSFWGPMFMLVVVAAFQIPLNAYTSTFAAVLVGLTGDNAIQFIFGSRRGALEQGLRSRRGGAIFTSVVMAICSLTFLGSAFYQPRVLGVLLCVGFLICLFGDYWVLKGLIREWRPHPGSNGEPPA